jgi:hypothetical protein
MGVVENMKDVADLVKKVGDIDLYRKILALEEEVIDLTRDKRRADDRIDELERVVKLKQELIFDEPFYWLKDDHIPFCPACWIDKQKAIHVNLIEEGTRYTKHNCPLCKHNYETPAGIWNNARRRRWNT